MEQFVTAALEAFQAANGDIDKFELSLRRALMNQQTIIPQALEPTLDDNFEISPEMAQELASVDLDNMSDDEVMQYALRMGLVK